MITQNFMSYWTFLLFGAIGGFARGFVGATKLFKKSENIETLEWPKLLLNIVGAGVIGGVVGLIVDMNPVAATTSGYAGIDVIESVIKISK